MTDDSQTEWVPTEALRFGLYVAHLDRPWIETPFLFQGFILTSEEDLTILRAHCEYVAVDIERSEATSLKEMRHVVSSSVLPSSRPAARQAGASGTTGDDNVLARRPGAQDSSRAFGERRVPDEQPFRVMVESAGGVRQRTREAVNSLLEDARFGRMIDCVPARHAVEEMTSEVTANATAALWLTNLKEQDEYTSIHCVNVCVLALAFGRHLGLRRDRLMSLGLGALLHDIGKARTPKAILDKDGPLTPDEFEIMKRHPEDGYQMVAPGGHVPRPALEIIRLHHERRNGQGYPFGLSGKRIPARAIITALADTYDAMTSDRVYRKAMSPQRALHTLYEEGDLLFGADFMQEFIRCIGIFPVGSVVQLDDGAIGLVVAARPDARLQPTLLLLRQADGRPPAERCLINLAGEAQEGADDSGRRITRSLPPENLDVDVPALVAEEFGLGET